MGCCYCYCLLCWLEETYSHIVGCQAPRLKKRSQNFQESRPPLSPSHIKAAGHFRGQFVRKKRWLEKPRAVLVASNLTNSDARPHNPPWATHSQCFLPLPGNHLRGRKKIVEESDDSRITTTRNLDCHIYWTPSISNILAPDLILRISANTILVSLFSKERNWYSHCKGGGGYFMISYRCQIHMQHVWISENIVICGRATW